MKVGRCPPSKAEELIGEEDVAVVVDALRASVTVAALLESGARSVKPVTEVPDELDDRHLFAGEDHGERIEGFDFGNSPLEILENADRIEAENVVLRTTNGTRCVERVKGAENVIMGSLVNMDPVIRSCEVACEGGTVWFVPAGRHGEPAPEDEYTVLRYIQKMKDKSHIVVGEDIGSFDLLESDGQRLFKSSDTGKFLCEKGYEDDVVFCSEIAGLSVSAVLRQGVFIRG
jgi:2-phosphosulfolactate phosphatase